MTHINGSLVSEQSICTQSRPLRVAVTGHMQLGDDATIAFVARTFDTLLAQLQREHPKGIVALSGLGAGADTIFAETALIQDIPLEVCIAAEDIIENFAPGPEQEQHMWLRAASRCVHTLSFKQRSNEAYMALGYWLVDSCDLLIAAWNGLPAAGLGGTGDVVAYARKQRRPIVHVHTREGSVEWFG